ncbi:MAG: HlyD family type I secretion periplasmic adaptor subunit [Magnetococcales bacterium]|nr:HlyD family type I secretion periplasmic adaptor subunit [Magnetococcales bacterium]
MGHERGLAAGWPARPARSRRVMGDESSLLDRHARRMLLVSALFFGLLLLWAAHAPLDVTTQAQGVVMPSSRVKSIQHLEGGIVQEILVREGETVRRDQPLLRLDPLRSNADFEELKRRLMGLLAEMGRLSAEVEEHDAPVFDPEVVEADPERVKTELATFQARRERFAHELSTLKSSVSQREQELVENRIRLESNQKILATVIDQVEISQKMMEGKLTSRMTHLELVRQQRNIEGQIAADKAAQPRLNAALKESRERADSLRANFLESARKDLTLARQNYDEQSQRLKKFRQAQDLTILRSPVEGIVKSMAVATEGGVIGPGQTVMEIVPVEDRLIIDARLPVQDIGYVHAGQKVWVALNSQDAVLFGRIAGAVEGVSPDALVTSEGKTFYRIRIVTDRNRFEAKEQSYALYPGVQVVCMILIGSRTVLDYLLTPWLRSLQATFQER